MSSRLKERGGAGAKVMALKPSKTLTLPSHQDKLSLQRIPLAAAQKELPRPIPASRPSIPRLNDAAPSSSRNEKPRPISTGRPSVTRTSSSSVTTGKENPRPFSASRASFVRSSNPHPKPEPAVRFSTSSLPRGKFTDRELQTSSFAERRSFTGLRALDKYSVGKVQTNSSGNHVKSLNVFTGILRDRRSNGCLGAKTEKSACKASDVKLIKSGCKPQGFESGTSDSAPNLKPVDKMVNSEVRVSENGHRSSTMGSYTNEANEADRAQGFLTVDVKALDKKPEVAFSADNITYNVENLSMEVGDVCTDNKYRSKLHEKLALLEDKVQKIALEIKQTKDMLDKNKSGESRLVLSDIRKKVSGVEKAVDSIKDGATSDSCIDSNMREKIENALPNIQSLNHEELESRFFPHHKLISDRVLPIVSSKSLDHGLVEQDSIAVEFLASLQEELPKPKSCNINMQLNHGIVNKVQVETTSSVQCGSRSRVEGSQQDVALESNENLEEFDTVENTPPSIACLGNEESSIYQLCEIGRKVSTGGWFVSEGEAVLLAHDDNSCSYYDIANSEIKSEYKAPVGSPSNLWGDCWLIRAPGIDGCSGRYVVAASAGNSLESGFCSWDFYTKDIKAFQVAASPGTEVVPTTTNTLHTSSLLENQSCWYRPCGPLLISTSCRQKAVKAYDIRDGDLVMTWEVSSPVTEMEYSSPLQWRSRGRVILAEREAITVWDVNSLHPQPTLTVPCIGKRILSLHVNNTDAEVGAGVRQRASSTEVEGNDGTFCTQDSVNVFDFRIPSGIGLKISRHGANALSIFSIGDSILVGTTEGRLPVKVSPRSNIEHFSLRKGSIVTTYQMPEFNSHYHHSSITQVWGNSNVAMGICGMGLYVFDAFKDEGLRSSSSIFGGSTEAVKETIGPDDLFRPTFDYVDSRALVISRDRPAFWRYLP